MTTDSMGKSGCECDGFDFTASNLLRREFGELQKKWGWFFLLGILLATCGTAAIVCPAMTVATSLLAVVLLGVLLMATGIATILGSYGAGRWSGLLLHLFVGVLYVVAGLLILDSPGKSALSLTMLLAVIFIVVGVLRTVGALVVRYPQWGWSLLNGIVTLLAGVVIYRHFAESAIWVIGLLVGLEMLFSGWTWIMLAIGVRNLPREAA